MIWTVDPLTFCLATLILVASLFAIGGWKRSFRAAGITIALVGYAILNATFSGRVDAAFAFQPLTVIGGVAACVAALVGTKQRGYVLSLASLVALAAATAGFRECPVGWIGLLHQVAVLDLTAVCIAVTAMGLTYTNQNEQNQHDWMKLPDRLGRRAAVMFLILCATLAYALYRNAGLFGASEIIALWAVGSEVLAAAVAWRVIQRWLKPGADAEKVAWKLKLGLFVAGTAASLGLLLIPVIIAAAEKIDSVAI